MNGNDNIIHEIRTIKKTKIDNYYKEFEKERCLCNGKKCCKKCLEAERKFYEEE